MKEKIILNNVDIKLKTNNSLENFNKLLKKQFLKKGVQEPYTFLDIIMGEVIKHENFINKINCKSFDKISISRLKGSSMKDNLNDSNFLKELKY